MSLNGGFWEIKNIYDDLMDPYIQTVDYRYFPVILESLLRYCRKIQNSFSIAILKIPVLLSSFNSNLTLNSYSFVRNISAKIIVNLNIEDMIFYNGKHTFLFLFPNTLKTDAEKKINTIRKNIEQIPFTVKGGYAEFPDDAQNAEDILECAEKALDAACISDFNGIIGYFTEKRKSTRVPVQVETIYAYGLNERLTCSRNISETGIMLTGMSDLSLGDGIKLLFTLPNPLNKKITAIARSIWNKICPDPKKMNIGLCFTELDNTYKEYIRKFVLSLPPELLHL